MSREVFTYPDLMQLNKSRNFQSLMKYPHIAVSSDLRKCLTGRINVDRVQGIASNAANFKATEFHSIAREIDDVWNTDKDKFQRMIYLSEFVRNKFVTSDTVDRNWLVGCMRNLDALMSTIVLLEQANVTPNDMRNTGDRNIDLLVEAWQDLERRDPSIMRFRQKMSAMKSKDAWVPILKKAFGIESLNKVDTLVFHGFYYFTPYQERVMELMESAGFRLVFLIPYDQRYPFVYEIWEQTYTPENGFAGKANWHIESASVIDPYGEIFEGNYAQISNNLKIKEYSSVMEFVDDIKRVKDSGTAVYSADFKASNQLLKDYYPDEYGDRKILSYPIGQFIGTLNRMWDEEKQTIAIDEDNLIDCFASGWLAVDGISGRQYLQSLVRILPFFTGCHSINDWETRLALFEEIQSTVVAPFETQLDPDLSVARWQEALGSPLKNFSMFAVDPGAVDVILKLIKQLLAMAKDLFGNNEVVRVHDHIRRLDLALKRHELSQELYAEERELVKDIFEALSADNSFDATCHPSDIARALDLFICGKYEEGEIQATRPGMVYPLYFVDAACIKSKSNVHVCLCDVNTLPGSNKDYIWPLTGKVMEQVRDRTQNPLLRNLIQIMESTAVCNRYFTYCALKNEDVTLSWVSTVGEKLLPPSPYIKLLIKATGTKIIPSARNAITSRTVANIPQSIGRIGTYDFNKAPVDMIKEARIAYALCPMKYLLGYVVEKYPTYESDFQMKYALNAFISAIYSLMKDHGVTVDEAYDAVVALFPNMRKVEKRQVYDYIFYDRQENDIDYGNFTECGGLFYTDERLKLHFPNQSVRETAMTHFGKLFTPDGRKGMDLYVDIKDADICIFCQHINCCRNAKFARDQEDYYD